MAENLLSTIIYTVTVLGMEYIGSRKKPLEVIFDLPFWIGFIILMFILLSKK